MKVIVIDDMVHPCSGDIGIVVPPAHADVPPERLRYVDGEFIDAADLSVFHLDALSSTKHVIPAEGRQAVNCLWDADLIKDSGQWRLRVPADQEVEAMAELRQRRDALLTSCDWTQIADAPLTEIQRAAWATYRQALRDLPETAGDPVVWPQQPGADT